jgi:hypothetical protein
MQTTSTILMIEPVAFGYNTETAANNYFMNEPDESAALIQANALKEFTVMVEQLRSEGIKVVVVRDAPEPPTPDSVFPNNWVSFHEQGVSVLYPMFAPSRRNERRASIFEYLASEGHTYSSKIDLTSYEQQHLFLEGTGSMVLDRRNKVAYAALSERTSPEVFGYFCSQLSYEAVAFNAYQRVGEQRLPVYHTNVVMSIAEQFVLICSESIDNLNERTMVLAKLQQTGKKIIEITEAQMHQFAGNMLQLRSDSGELKLVVSGSAYASLRSEQIAQLMQHTKIVVCEVPTIEKYGGGSVRCMMAEIF